MTAIDLPLAEMALLPLGLGLAWLSARHPGALPAWAPWDFSWPAFLGLSLATTWFVRGYCRSRSIDRLPPWRCAGFLAGVALLYVVLLTRFEYLAQHLFLLNRVQHLVLHHLGPFLIALSWPGATIARGIPPALSRHRGIGLLRPALRVLQQPIVAGVLFEGILLVWLIPAVMFRAMLDWRLYAVMNLSMIADGLLFWFLVLDPRPAPLAPVGFVARLCLAFLIIFPQIMAGTAIELVRYDLYPSFALCGRVYPEISPTVDQQIGALILWVPAGMMSSLASLLIIFRMFRHEDAKARATLLPRCGEVPA